MMECMEKLLRRANSRAVHECVKCGACFCHTRKLVEHLKNLHDIDRAFSCDECGKTFRSPMNIARHKRIHTDLKRFSCDLCDYRSNQKSNLEIHRRRHTKDYAFRCEECQKGFVSRAEYLVHVNVHTRKHIYRCEHCDKSYPYKKNLTTHRKRQHPSTLPADQARNAKLKYACKVCLEGFAQKLLLDRHLKKQHGLHDKVKHLCDMCGAVLSSKRRLMEHRRGHAYEKTVKCELCDKMFASKEYLSVHRRIHTGEKPSCTFGTTQGKGRINATTVARASYLAASFRNIAGCTRNLRWSGLGRDEEAGSDKRACLELIIVQWDNGHEELASCDDFKIKSEDILLQTGQKFEGNEKACDLCQEKFHFVTRLVAHLRIVHGIHRPFKCDTCGKTYPQQFMLNAHVKKSHTPKTIPCNQCNFMGVNATDVERHTKRHHREEKFTCEICSESFEDTDSLMTHTTMHNFMQYQQCNACGSTFNDVYSLKEHNRLYHYDPAALMQEKLEEGDQQTSEHKCNVCGKVYKYKSVLKQHKVKAHGDTPNYERRRYLCALCGKELKTAKGLEIHNRSHTGEKPYTCEVCGKCFACETLLRTHNVTHTGERKYSCDQCGKAFTQRSTLVVHKRYHTGERPYVCPRCGKGFVTRTVLNTHMKSCR
ncbi:uncharacterized protein LOC143371211 [Andrena cerasifolii]|uniref:uncharacterized protein LOC143371211 n=1 Tax=Andrena cerasifolii TaxID=2819439 RepID=UPI00403839F8